MKKIKKFLHHLFLPHHTNNHRAKLLHHSSILTLAILLFVANVLLTQVKNAYPNVLGSAINISVQDLLSLTNTERQKLGLPALSYNDQLAVAARAKAANMFADNYWAHINPKTGQTPWVFIQAAGYQYTYAGENLARGFTNTQDVINAWMASPTHRANVVSRNYQDVGFAIQQGNLTGETDTTLVVEEFGGKAIAPLSNAQAAPAAVPQVAKSVLAEGNDKQVQYQSVTTSPVVDRFAFAKNITQFLLLLFIVIFILDFILIERKKIVRIVGHNLDHILFLTAVLLIIGFLGAGSLL